MLEAPEIFNPKRTPLLTWDDLNAKEKLNANRIYSRILRASGIPPGYLQRATLKSLKEIEDAKVKSRDIVLDFSYGHLEKNSLYVFGEYGTGKTHMASFAFKQISWRLAQGYSIKFAEKAREGKVYEGRLPSVQWITFPELCTEIIDSINEDGSAKKVRERYKQADLLLIDDLGNQIRKDETEYRKELLYLILNFRHNRDMPTIVTTNFSLSESASQYGPQLAERILESYFRVEIKGSSFRKSSHSMKRVA